MKKQLVIEGMSCGHCSSRVKNALEGIDGISDVDVDLGAKTASFNVTEDFTEDFLKNVITDIGYELVDIK